MKLDSNNYKFIKTSNKDFAKEIVLDRPDVHNALNERLLEELLNEINRIEKDKKVRFAVIKGSGKKSFSAGADLKEGHVLDKEKSKDYLYKFNKINNKIEDSRLIYFAAIDGYALGGGLELALACDIRIATSKSVFGLPEVKLGVIPGGGGISRLIKVCGFSNAKELVLLGEKIDSETAKYIDLINEVVENSAALENKVKEYISLMRETNPNALSQAKFCLNNDFKRERKRKLEFERKIYKKLLKNK